jgi:hypothetical protein
MAVRQGLVNLTKGYKRKATKSEISRGYLFVSTDKEIAKLKTIKVIINGTDLGAKKMDNSGRIWAGKDLTEAMAWKECCFKLLDGTLTIIF